MNRTLQILLVVLFAFVTAPVSRAALPAMSTEWEGVIAAINPTSVAVKSPKGTRVFTIYPGTVFGQRAAKTVNDFKAGDKVLVIFSTLGQQTKAENIRNPDDDRKPAKKKGKAAKKK